MAERIVQEESLTLVADAIRAKGGTTDALSFPDGFKTAIEAIQAGGGGGGSVTSVPMKEVNFYDYDGTRLYSYTVAEAQALTELPALPTQPGLICQGWNWSLEDIKAHNRAVDVGAMYITDDGKTRLYITIAAEGRMTVPLRFTQTVANGVTIDWGDGSAAQTLSGTGAKNATHTYTSIGDYVITLDVAEGCELGLGSGSNSYCIMGSSGDSNKVYCNMLKKVEMGKNTKSVSAYAFYNCYSLESVVVPNGVTSVGTYAFYTCGRLLSVVVPNGVTSVGTYAFSTCTALRKIMMPNGVMSIGSYTFYACYSLENVVIPSSATNIGSSAFYECRTLESVVVPNGVTNVGANAFYRCSSLASVAIPNSVTNLDASAFRYCCGMAFYDFSNHTSVPTLANTNAFGAIPSDCQIRVPAELYDEWIAATNWSTYASQIVAV